MKLSKFQEEPICVKVFDVETKKVLGVHPNYKRAALALGVTDKAVYYRCNKKIKFFSPKLQKEVACRIVKK